jgi:TolB protein
MEGQVFDVLEGPVCADGYAWWKIDLEGLVGWAVEGQPREYWLEPYPSAGDAATPAPISPGQATPIPTFAAQPSPIPSRLVADNEEVIAYVDVLPGQSMTTLFVMNIDGSNPRQLVDRYASVPVWSPDGRWLVFSGGYMHLLDVTTGIWRPVMGRELVFPNVSWSPDSLKVAVATNTGGDLEVQVLDVLTGEHSNLSDNAFNDYDPSWSPDGKHIIFVSDRDGPRDVYRMDADGSNVVRLTRYDDAAHPVYSPDGAYIAWSRNTALDIMEADGSNHRPLSIGHTPNWSPDGKHIVYTYYEYVSRQNFLEIIDFDGSNRKRVETAAATSPYVSWSADGTYFVFEAGAFIYRAHVDLTEVIPIGRAAEYPAPNWRPVRK